MRTLTFYILLCLGLLFGTAPQPLRASSMSSVYLEDLTWPELKERINSGTDTVLIPTGGTEQNGPHIALGKHNWIIRYTAGEIAKQLGNVIVAPVIAHVPEGDIAPPNGHMLFPGTLSLREETFAALLEDTASSLKQAGFTHIYFIGDSGGNQSVQEYLAERLNKRWKEDGVTVMNVNEYYANTKATVWAKEQALGGSDAAAHAGFMDTSELLAIHPKGIRPEHIRSYAQEDTMTTGVVGDPVQANADYGKQLLKFKIEAAVTQIRSQRKK